MPPKTTGEIPTQRHKEPLDTDAVATSPYYHQDLYGMALHRNDFLGKLWGADDVHYSDCRRRRSRVSLER